MKSSLRAIIILILFSSTSFTQVLPWRTLLDFGTGEQLQTIETDPVSKILYAASTDRLIRISNNGNTFDTVKVNTSSSVLSLGHGLLFVGDDEGLGIQKSTDNGDTWIGIFPYRRLTDIFYDGYRLWATDEDRVLLISDDLGKTWEINSFNTNQQIVSLCVDSPHVYIGVNFGGYYYSENYGTDWNRINDFSGPGYVCKGTDDVIYLVSGTNLIYSSDKGKNWDQQPLLTRFPKYLTIDSFDNLYYSDGRQGLFESTDQGFRWNKISTFCPSKIEFIDSSIFIMDPFQLLAYIPGYTYETGRNMFPLSLNNKYQFLNHDVLISEGFSTYSLALREIVKDTIIDEHEYYYFNNPHRYFRYIPDSNLAFIRYDDPEGLYADFNLYSGQTYMQFDPVSHTYHEVMVETDSVMFFGEVRKIFKWVYGYKNESFAENLGIIHNYSYSSFAGGGYSSKWLIGALIKDTLGSFNYYSAGHKPEILFEPFDTLSLSTVITFSATINHANNALNSIHGELSDGVIYIDSAYVEYFYKKDTIETSRQIRSGYRTPVTFNYHFTLFIDTIKIKAGYQLYYRIVSSDKALVPQYSYSPDSGYYVAEYNPVLTSDDAIILYTYKLDQNYPNPFNPLTNIKFSVPRLTKVVIKIYDILGNEIKTLINDEKVKGNYEITFDGANLSSGIYFLKMQAGSFSEIKKMILLK